jgi:hypothetical protein
MATCGAAPDFADAHPGYCFPAKLTFARAGMFGHDEKSIRRQPTIRPDVVM